MADKTVPISFAKGLANRQAETKLPPGYARAAVNVDISNDGVVSRREGYTLFAALPGAHSLWSHPGFMYALVAAGDKLYSLTAEGVLEQAASGLSGGDVHYCMTPIGVYWSDGNVCGKVTLAGDARAWGVETPSNIAVAALSAGGMDAGAYSVSATFVNSDGEEGGATALKSVDVLAGGGITVSVPTAVDFNVTEVRVYVTTANGQELQYAGSVVPGSTYMVVATPRGRRLDTNFMRPVPPMRYPQLKHGRLIGAVDRRLVWSEPMRYGLYRYATNFASLPATITMVAAADATAFLMYIGTDARAYKFEGESLEQATLTVLAHIGVVPGSMAMVSPDALAIEGVTTWSPVWVDKTGVPTAGVQGTAVPLHTKFAYPQFAAMAATFFQKDGDSRYIAAGRGSRPSVLTVGDYVTAKVIDAGGGTM